MRMWTIPLLLQDVREVEHSPAALRPGHDEQVREAKRVEPEERPGALPRLRLNAAESVGERKRSSSYTRGAHHAQGELIIHILTRRQMSFFCSVGHFSFPLEISAPPPRPI